MADGPGDEEEDWFRPVWETETEDELDPPGLPPARRRPAEPDYDHPLLTPLARAQDAVARLEARHAHVWLHPWDLALRDSGSVISYGAAARGGRLAAVLPTTVAQHGDLDGVVETGAIGLDIAANRALRLARLWRRLAELRTWRPVADAEAVRHTLRSLHYGRVEDGVIEDWLAGVYSRDRGPDLIRAGRAAADWLCQPGVTDRDPEGVFLGACLWHEKNRTAPIPLPFWSAPEHYHHRLTLRVGLDWMAQFLECVTAAAQTGLREHARLLEAEHKRADIAVTARSRLPDALDALLRAPVVTTEALAASIRVTPRAALGLLGQLTAAGLVREVTGRASWRAYALI